MPQDGLQALKAKEDVASKVWEHLNGCLAASGKSVVQASGPGSSRQEVPLQVLEKFIDPEDSAGLIGLANANDLWEDAITYARDARGQPAARKAESAWLPQDHPLVVMVRKAAAQAFGLTPAHVEPVRLARYRYPDSKFAPHVDWAWEGEVDAATAGQRIGSAIVYLTDVPAENNGTTVFPNLGLEVKPQNGRAVVWPNVDATGRPLAEVEVGENPMTNLPATSLIPLLQDDDDDRPTKVTLNVWVRDRPLALTLTSNPLRPVSKIISPPKVQAPAADPYETAAKVTAAREQSVPTVPLLFIVLVLGAIAIIGATLIGGGGDEDLAFTVSTS